MDIMEIVSQLALAAVPVLAGLLGWVWLKVNKVVKDSPNKIDDAALAAVKKVISDSQKPAE